MIKKATAVLALLAFAFSLLTSCANNPITVYVGGAPEALGPHSINTKADEIYTSLLFNGLYKYEKEENGEYRLSPDDAEGYPTVSETDDGKTVLLFRIKSNMKWSNGEPITAEDYVYSWNLAASSYVGSDKEYIFQCFEGFKSFLDPDVNEPKLSAEFDNKNGTIRVTLVEGAERFLEYTTLPCMFPVSRIAVRDSKDWHKEKKGFASNGAFKLSSIDKSRLVIEKNENNGDNPTVDKITFIFDEASAKRRAEKGYIDVSFTESGKNASSNVGMTFLAFNANDSAIGVYAEEDKLRIRTALAIYAQSSGAFDSIPEGLVPSIRLQSNTVLPNAGDHGMTSLDYADLLMQSASEHSGFFSWQDGKAFEFPILTAISAGRAGEENALEKISKKLYEKGITLRIRSLSWSDFLDERDAGEFSFLLNSWSYTSENPAELLRNFMSESVYNDTLKGRDDGSPWAEQYDSLLMISPDDSEKACEKYAEALKLLTENALVVPMSYVKRNYYLKDGVRAEVTPNGLLRFE